MTTNPKTREERCLFCGNVVDSSVCKDLHALFSATASALQDHAPESDDEDLDDEIDTDSDGYTARLMVMEEAAS